MKYIFSITIFIFLILSCKREIKFNKYYWNKNPNNRYKMARDLIQSNILLGKSKGDVRLLLTNDCKYCDDNSNNWIYFLGEGFNKLDRKWEVMDIEFIDGKVALVSIRE